MKFKVGDLCVIVGGPHWQAGDDSKRIGKECSILVGTNDEKFGPCYDVKCADGMVVYITEKSLRLRRPPSWDSWLYDTDKVKDDQHAYDVRRDELTAAYRHAFQQALTADRKP
jgi:hypothetical protein